jgi:hypothetical protein
LSYPSQLKLIAGRLTREKCIQIVEGTKAHSVPRLAGRTANMGQHENIIKSAERRISTRLDLKTIQTRSGKLPAV